MNKVQEISGHQYEYKCAEKLKKCGFTNVTVTRGSGDQGIDIIAYRKGSKYGIQCKYYTGSVGNFAVQEAYAGARHYNCDFAAVMTNSNFTKSAKELAGSTNVILWENDKLPFAVKQGSKITRIIGAFVCIVAAIGLLTMGNAESIHHPALQRAEMIFLLMGGILNILESGIDNWAFCSFAFFLYLIALILQIIVSLLSTGSFLFDWPIFAVAIFCLIRTVWLYKKTYFAKTGTKESET